MPYPTRVETGNRNASPVYSPTLAIQDFFISSLALRERGGGFLNEHSHLGMARLEIHVNPEFFQRFAGRRTDRPDHRSRKSVSDLRFDTFLRGDLKQVRNLNRGGE